MFDPQSTHPRVSPLLRGGTFAALALFTLKQTFQAPKYTFGTPAPRVVWGAGLLVTAAFIALAVLVAREARPKEGTWVFHPIRFPLIAELAVVPFGGLFGLMWAAIPGELAERGFRDESGVWLFLAPLFFVPLLLWRPAFYVRKGEVVMRFPLGAWCPWYREGYPMEPRLTWEKYFAKRVGHVGWILRAKLAQREFELEFVGLDVSEAQRDAIKAEWREVMGGVAIGTVEERDAARQRKKVMPWHIMSGMFGVPGLFLVLINLSQPQYDSSSVIGMVVATLVLGALAFWFISRFLTETQLSVALLVTAAIAGLQLYRGHLKGEAQRAQSRALVR